MVHFSYVVFLYNTDYNIIKMSETERNNYCKALTIHVHWHRVSAELPIFNNFFIKHFTEIQK